MHLQQLRAFCEVAAELSFTSAARNLNYAQSSVTAQIQNLEDTVGASLFDRSGRRVALTEAGRRLLPHAERIITAIEEARLDIAALHARNFSGFPIVPVRQRAQRIAFRGVA
ncbi:hypothetical protein GCM10009759_17980 [Kitasatospora saccharophila]|uniref:HTH lysR-type domain-containing protein n=1 Tax=Kitasatospora saccharophila TaxID=407973 RepID=A0ABN2WID0_9ACTN